MWQPLHVHSHFSLLDSASKPEDIIREVARKGYRACGLTDHGSMSGSVDFSIAATKANIKPILGSEIYICEQDSSIKDASNRSLSHLVVLARNKVGYSNLCKLTTRSWENMYYRPRLSLDEFLEFSEGLIVINGHPGSHLHKCILNHDLEYAKKQANKMLDILGENFFVEINLVDNSESSLEIGKTMRDIAKSIGSKKVASCDSHYTNKSLAIDQQILLCINTKTTLKDVREKIENEEEYGLSGFFKTDGFDIPELSRMESLHQGFEEELENAELIVDMVENYSILSSPKTPHFACPNGMSEKDYLLALCREGWKKRSAKIAKEKNPIYVDRINKELAVFNSAGLEGYFLIVQDYVNWAKNQGYLVGSGRGCFLPETRVKMSDGTYTPISLIKNGDIVVDAYGKPQEVCNTLEYDIDEEIIELEFENGKIIRCTKEHKFLTKNRGWVESQYLTENDDIVEN